MKEPGYIETLQTSWRLVWEHKLLWVFGLFAGMLGPLGIVTITKRLAFIGTKHTFYPGPLVAPEYYDFSLGGSFTLPIDGWLALLWLVAIFIGFGLILLFVSVVSQGALVHSVAQYETWAGRSPQLATAWHAGVTHFWRILSINLIGKIVVGFVSLVMAFAFLNAFVEPTLFDSLLFVILFVLTMVVGVCVSFLAIYAVGYVVVEEYGLLDAIAASWKLFLSHWLVSIEIGIILLAVNFAFATLLAASFFVLVLPALLLWVLALSVFSQALSVLGIFIATGLFTFFFVIVSSIIAAFTTTVWTHLFMKMHRHGLGSAMLRWARFH